jgi:hypothetical protein
VREGAEASEDLGEQAVASDAAALPAHHDRGIDLTVAAIRPPRRA